ncbi:MAG: phosphoenolpyruvate--protein phosphotransferase [Pseudomonadota bacterium]|nr:phosphoenolpyruvate--protein phosphotransferase [Pseudomonadota bacterium]
MSIILTGDGVSRGICIGNAIVVNKDNIDYAPSFIDKSEAFNEKEKFLNALSRLKKEYKKSSDKIKNNQTITKLMDMQLSFIEDIDFKKNVLNKIKNNLYTASWSISSEYLAIKKSFDDVKDKYIRERLIDIKQMIMSLIELLQSNEKMNNFNNKSIKGKIIVTEEITPKDVIDIYHNKGIGVISSHGSKSSHSAILSKSLSLPMIVKVESSTNVIKNNDQLIIDPENQLIIINPNQFERQYFKKNQLTKNNLIKSFKKNSSKKAITKDKIEIDVLSNLELSEEVKLLKDNSDGIGLFRTEYLYMNRDDLPTEKEQVLAYKKVFKKLNNKPVTIRTLDIGSDKEVSENIQVGQIAKNPALGLRGIRYSLSEKNIFKTQIKAMLVAAYNSNLRILIPMITSLDEIMKAKELINDAKLELNKEKRKYNDNFDLGIMIEVPASAIQASLLSKHVDFMSIGTNDLVQYILATDRIDDEVADLYDPTNPAVLSMIKEVINSCKKSRVDVSVCGEMAGEKMYTKLLLGLGLRSFSMHPQVIPEIKNIIMNTNVRMLRKKTNAILQCSDYNKRMRLIETL